MHHFGYSMNFNDIIHCEGGNKREGAEKRSSGEAEKRRIGEAEKRRIQGNVSRYPYSFRYPGKSLILILISIQMTLIILVFYL